MMRTAVANSSAEKEFVFSNFSKYRSILTAFGQGEALTVVWLSWRLYRKAVRCRRFKRLEFFSPIKSSAVCGSFGGRKTWLMMKFRLSRVMSSVTKTVSNDRE